MMDEPLLGLPPYVSTGIVQHLSARDLCTLAQVCILLLEAIAVHLDKETEIPMHSFLTIETFCSQHSRRKAIYGPHHMLDGYNLGHVKLRQEQLAAMQASKCCWQLVGLCTEVEVVFQAEKLGQQSASLRNFVRRHGNRVRPLEIQSHSPALHRKAAPWE